MFVFNGGDRINTDNVDMFSRTLNAYHYVGRNKVILSNMRWKDGDTISIDLPQHNFRQKTRISAGVWLVRYKDILVEKVNEGENKDRVQRFSNVVQSIKHVGKWYGAPRLIEVDVPKPQGGKESGGYVVLVGELMGSDLMSAGKLKDYDPLVSAPAGKP